MASTTSTAPNTDGSNALIGILVIVAIVFLGLTYFWCQDIAVARQAKKWPTVQGTVISTRAMRICKGGYFQAVVHYAYEVEGRSYTGDRIAIGPVDCSSENEARTLAAQYPVGNVKVWFNPQNPEIAVLMVGTVFDKTWTSIYTTTCLSVILFLVAGFWFRSTPPKLKS